MLGLLARSKFNQYHDQKYREYDKNNLSIYIAFQKCSSLVDVNIKPFPEPQVSYHWITENTEELIPTP